MGSAIRAFAQFAKSVPNRVLFRTPTVIGDLAVAAHNEWTLCLWAVFEAERISDKTKDYIKADTISQRVSLFKGLVSHRYGFQVAGDAPRLAALVRRMRQEDPRGGSRKKRRGLRHRHLRELWRTKPAVREGSFARLNKWAALTTARHVLARGGELSTVKRSDLRFKVPFKCTSVAIR